MFRPSRKLLVVGVVLAAAMAVGASQSEAGWWHRSCCYSPCYSSCYSPCYTSCYSPGYSVGWTVGYRPGPIRRLLFGPYRYWPVSYGWSSGWTSSSSWSVACCDPVVVSQPAASAAPTPAPRPRPDNSSMPNATGVGSGPSTGSEPSLAPSPPSGNPAGGTFGPPAPATPRPGPSASRHGQESGMISILVPVDAKVVINGHRTKSTGTQREYISHGLKSGNSYKYEIRAEILRDGRPVVETRTVYLRAGAHEQVAIHFNPGSEEVIASL